MPTGSIGSQKAISIGSPKIASTGSQKPTTIGISTGSLKKGQQKEKSDEILAREVEVVLATLSTSPKQKEKRKRETPLYFKQG